jgi:hypothetical protein
VSMYEDGKLHMAIHIYRRWQIVCIFCVLRRILVDVISDMIVVLFCRFYSQ